MTSSSASTARQSEFKKQNSASVPFYPLETLCIICSKVASYLHQDQHPQFRRSSWCGAVEVIFDGECGGVVDGGKGTAVDETIDGNYQRSGGWCSAWRRRRCGWCSLGWERSGGHASGDLEWRGETSIDQPVMTRVMKGDGDGVETCGRGVGDDPSGWHGVQHATVLRRGGGDVMSVICERSGQHWRVDIAWAAVGLAEAFFLAILSAEDDECGCTVSSCSKGDLGDCMACCGGGVTNDGGCGTGGGCRRGADGDGLESR